MKIDQTVLLLPIGFTLLLACAGQKQEVLVGDWRVERLLEEEREINFDELQEVRFSFSPSGRYYFRSTLNYREAGYYRRSGNSLHIIDTLKENPTERRIKILKTSPSLLQFQMKSNDSKRVLDLVRVDSL